MILPPGPISAILGVDPASQVAGVCLVQRPLLAPSDVLDIARIHSHKKTASERIDIIVSDLLSIAVPAFERFGAGLVAIVEIPQAAVNVKKRAGFGLTTLGRAAGECRRALMCAGLAVLTVDERTWTDQQRKGDRLAVLEASGLGYRRDTHGEDAGDALGLAVWLDQQLRLRECAA